MLFLISIPAFFLSLIWPKAILPLFRGKLDEKGMRWLFGLLIPVFLILIGITADQKEVQNKVPVATNQEASQTKDAPITQVEQDAEDIPESATSKVETKKETPKTYEETRQVQPIVVAPTTCGEDYYKNVDGNCIRRPSSSPSGASAKCRDGSYSYSAHRQGTCSGHGGVASWL
jgi:hypothetical protein